MLTLICGLPNAGKTTYSQKFQNVLHADDYTNTDDLLKLVSKNIKNICVEGIFMTHYSRKRLLNVYNGNKTKCIFIDTPLDICLKRENRKRLLQVIRNCSDIFEPPTYSEGWDEIEIIKWEENIR